jgi:hypothetical protein
MIKCGTIVIHQGNIHMKGGYFTLVPYKLEYDVHVSHKFQMEGGCFTLVSYKFQKDGMFHNSFSRMCMFHISSKGLEGSSHIGCSIIYNFLYNF